ncbi:hypothetical protein HWV23_11355 [Natronomonas halophila]|uniref:DUF7286 family protein n=1 Tax=Natronomonas halophila TaxID=2747817 RepID=UPI0015B5B219|nr:hypothetical protein [Natronomonas halophila]QLD86294.1 hypothetical protein HWV23_11355 [Natronomonas halophila]
MNDRARVPFALVGVLLLVSSTTLTATIGTEAPADRPSVDRAMDGATAESVTALRAAADEAATEAAAAPVTRPANTTAGRALNDTQPFRDALRLRLYLAARERLTPVAVERGGVTATASLPAVESTTRGYREAIDHVTVERAGEDRAALRVTIENVTLTATRGERQVAETERSPTFVVANPALLLHDRTERFERRATAPVTETGISRRLTARLYPIAWTRGYAQHGGAPIANVVGTRHVELATNDALVAEQQAVFGATDPDGHRGVAAAGRRVATTDALLGAGGDEKWVDAVLGGANEVGQSDSGSQPVGAWRSEPPAAEVSVGVNRSADHAYAEVVGIRGEDQIARHIDRAHTVEARVDASVENRGSYSTGERSPGGDWTLVDVRRETSVSLDDAEAAADDESDWTTRRARAFEAVETATTTRTWRQGNRTTTTVRTSKRRYRVSVTLRARTAPIDGVPSGRLDGALAPATDRATDEALREAGGFRTAARSVVSGGWSPTTATATADRTVSRADVLHTVRPLRETTRNHTVRLPAPAVGAGRANPPARLRESLADRREELLGPPDRSAEPRAKRAGRAAYLDALGAELDGRADTHAETNTGIEAALGEHLPADRLDGALAAHRAARRPDPPRTADPAGNLSFAVETGPSYLTTGSVARDRIGARGEGRITPLATRNVNVFTSPHDGVAQSIVDRIPYLGADRIALSTAASTLLAAERSDTDAPDLEREVGSANAHVRGALVAVMVDEGISERDARAALETDAGTAEAALALANGTTADRAAATVADSEAERDRLRVRLRRRLDATLAEKGARPPRSATTPIPEALRAEYSRELRRVAADGIEAEIADKRKRLLGKRLGALPAGLPIAPVPGYWYATANVWYVEAAGEYERFVVRADRGGPSGAVTYIRDGRAARIDSRDARLGTAERVPVRLSTAVVVVVPPGPRGVGDTDGVADERSQGWPP